MSFPGLKSLFLSAALFLLAQTAQAETAYFPGHGKDIEKTLSENALSPDGNIKATLLHSVPGASFHLIQIRRAEKPHVHEAHDLIVMLKKGKGALKVEDKTFDMEEGDWAFIPKNAPHFFTNTGENPAVGIGIFLPAYDGKDNVPVK